MKMHELKQSKTVEKVFLALVQVTQWDAVDMNYEYEEMKELVESAQGSVVGHVPAKIFKPNSKYFIGQGKLEEMKAMMADSEPDLVVFNVDLTPVQSRNLESFFKKRIVDRTGLILDIFARRAKSKDGKVQVELAQLQYLLPRLSVLWEEMSRLGGGIGTRGPGEQQREIERRRIQRRIEHLKKDMKKIKKHRKLIRSGRSKKNFSQIAIVGYTNAGKSTLLNALTQSDAYVQDQLFATLDPKTRLYEDDRGGGLLFTDTVGFIRNLPHGLVDAFHGTLEEAIDADLILLVLDSGSDYLFEHYEVVEKVLEELKVRTDKKVIALNKSDSISEDRKAELGRKFPDAVFVSATEKEGLEDLVMHIKNELIR